MGSFMKRISTAMLVLASLAAPAGWANGFDARCDCDTTVPSEQKPKPRPKPRVARKAAPAVRKVPVVVNEINVQPARPPEVNVMLSQGNDSCVSSPVAGASLSSGSVWTDWNCVTLKKSAALASIGERNAALALLCENKDMHQALERAGTSCPGSAGGPQQPVRDVKAAGLAW